MPTSDRARGAIAAALILAGCSQAKQPANPVLAAGQANGQAAADNDGRILCAEGSAALTRSCTVEETTTGGGDGKALVLTVRAPDGGFRRLLVTHDGRGLVAADGAEPAKVAIVGRDLIEVTIGRERYRLPATVRQ